MGIGKDPHRSHDHRVLAEPGEVGQRAGEGHELGQPGREKTSCRRIARVGDLSAVLQGLHDHSKSAGLNVVAINRDLDCGQAVEGIAEVAIVLAGRGLVVEG